MKYENFDQAKDLVNKISELKNQLRDLECDNMGVKVYNTSNGYTIYQKSAGLFDDPYCSIANNFINEVKTQLINDIENLKVELDLL